MSNFSTLFFPVSVTLTNYKDSAIWDQTSSVVIANSASWNSAYTTTKANSATWDSTSTVVQQDSAFFVQPSVFTITTTNNLSPFGIENQPAVCLYPVNRELDVYVYQFGQTAPTIFSFSGNIYRGNLYLGGGFIPAVYNGPAQITVSNLVALQGGVSFTSFLGYNATNDTGPISALNFPDLKYCYSVTMTNNRGLTSVSFPELEIVDAQESGVTVGGYLGQFSLRGINFGQTGGASTCPISLTEVSFPKLKVITAGGNSSDGINIGGYRGGVVTGNAALRSISFPMLSSVQSVNIGNSQNTNTTYFNVSSINFSSLRRIGDASPGSFSLSRIGISALDLPELLVFSNGGAISVQDCPNLREITAPKLQYVGGYIVNTNTCPALSGIYFNALRNIKSGAFSLTISNGVNLGLSAVFLGENTLETIAPTSLTCSQSLTQASVDSILKAFARLDGTSQRTNFASGATLTLAGNNRTPSYTGGVTTTSAGTNFTRAGTTVTANVVGHAHTTGDIVTFTGNSVAALNGTYTVTVVTPDQFQYTTSTSGDATGDSTVTMRRTTVATDGFRSYQTIALRGATITINFP